MKFIIHKTQKSGLDFVLKMDFSKHGIFYVYNPGEIGSPVVFLHGLGEDQTIFNHQISYFQERGRPTLSLDLRGHGRSPVCPRSDEDRISIQSHARDLEDILCQEKIENINLVGFSLGGTVALEYVQKNHNNVDKMVLINPVFYDQEFLTPKVKRIVPILKLSEKLIPFNLKWTDHNADLSKALFSNAYFSFLNGFRVTSLEGLYSNIGALMDYGIPTGLSEIETPTLIMASNRDELLTPGMAQFIYLKILNSQESKFSEDKKDVGLETFNGKHVLMLNRPSIISHRMDQFF